MCSVFFSVPNVTIRLMPEESICLLLMTGVSSVQYNSFKSADLFIADAVSGHVG